jgi:hypothetical protein
MWNEYIMVRGYVWKPYAFCTSRWRDTVRNGGLKCFVCVSAVERHSSAFGGFVGDWDAMILFSVTGDLEFWNLLQIFSSADVPVHDIKWKASTKIVHYWHILNLETREHDTVGWDKHTGR